MGTQRAAVMRAVMTLTRVQSAASSNSSKATTVAHQYCLYIGHDSMSYLCCREYVSAARLPNSSLSVSPKPGQSCASTRALSVSASRGSTFAHDRLQAPKP
eukprot:4413-Heterococcus_DN1.PRE.2